MPCEIASPVLEEIDFPKKHSPLFQNMGKYSKGHNEDDKGQHSRTRIGVQKGSTLLKALSDKTSLLSQDFDILKKQRRDNIINIIKTSGGNATIKDIKIKIDAGVNGGVSFSEKTLQRELLSLIKDRGETLEQVFHQIIQPFLASPCQGRKNAESP